jgi:hypothetical protein
MDHADFTLCSTSQILYRVSCCLSMVLIHLLVKIWDRQYLLLRLLHTKDCYNALILSCVRFAPLLDEIAASI